MKTNEIKGRLKYIINVYQTQEQEEANLATFEINEPKKGLFNSVVFEDYIFNTNRKLIIIYDEKYSEINIKHLPINRE